VLGKFLGTIWPVVLILFVLVFLVSVAIAIFGWPMTAFFDAETAFGYLNTMALWMVVLMVLSAITAFAHDIQEQNKKEFEENG
jgi:hypothetical protein